MIDTKFDIGAEVHVDGDTSITAYVTGYIYRGFAVEYEAGWMHDGHACSAWFPVWRLSKKLTEGCANG